MKPCAKMWTVVRGETVWAIHGLMALRLAGLECWLCLSIHNPMKSLVTRILLTAGGLLVGGFYIIYGCPSLWAEDVAVSADMNAHLVAQTFDQPEDAALEALNWNVIREDRTPRADGNVHATQLAAGSFKVTLQRPAQDDSIHQTYNALTLAQVGTVWKVTRHQRCWTGRGLLGWSSKPAS